MGEINDFLNVPTEQLGKYQKFETINLMNI